MNYIQEAVQLAAHGGAHLNAQVAQDIALGVVRVAVGGFFAISGYNKLFVPARHASLKANLTRNNIPAIRVMQWWVPGWEFIAGLMLAVGLFSAFAAGVLMIICAVAICCEAKEKVAKFAPINAGDVVADYLYLPEVLYAVLLVVNLVAGTGRYSLDWYLFPLFR
jgi:putative oxidoreductase